MVDMSSPDGVRSTGREFHGFAERAADIAANLKDLRSAKGMGAAFAEEAEAMQRGLDKAHIPFQHHGDYNKAFGDALHWAADAHQGTDERNQQSLGQE